ncbi:MAG: FkbM family methyltransferase [Candidatus Marsarchaeota archaeon]|nr:FkbM family methyltransferase [Candidatus Marsarchaeota archaeon]
MSIDKLLSEISHKLPNWEGKKLVGRFIRNILVASHKRRKISSPFLINNSYWMYTDDVDSLGLINGTYETEETKFFKESLKTNDIVLDLGANIGYYTLLFAILCKKVYAFEPDNYNYKLLIKNIKLNISKGTIKASTIVSEQKAVSDKNTILRMAVEYSNRGANTISRLGTEKINAIRIDDYFKNRVKPTVIKMDIEGHEAYAIRGGIETFKSARLVVLEATNEKGGRHSEAIRQLEDAGFTIKKIKGYVDGGNFYGKKFCDIRASPL